MGYSSDLNSIGKVEKNKYKHFQINLKDKHSTNNAIKQADPDIVIHLAAESHVDRSIDSPKIFVDSNIYGTFNLLEASLNHWQKLSKSRKENFRFHHISTDEVFGSLGKNGIFTEKSPYQPRSPYSATKAASDHLVNSWHHTYGLPTLITNCSNNYGPYQFPEKLIPIVILKALEEKHIPIYGNGENIRDWLYVNDHIEGILLTASKGKVGESYCIGGNNEITNKQLVLKICSILDKIKPIKRSYSSFIKYIEDRPGHDKRYAIDASKIKNELGWKPKWSLDEGIKETVNWYLNNLDWCYRIMDKSGYKGERIGNLKSK